jgi:hypothetical protein
MPFWHMKKYDEHGTTDYGLTRFRMDRKQARKALEAKAWLVDHGILAEPQPVPGPRLTIEDRKDAIKKGHVIAHEHDGKLFAAQKVA